MAILTGPAPPPIAAFSESMVNHALRLLATAEVAEPAAAARASERLAAWRSRSAAHDGAHAEASRRWHALAGAAAGLSEQWTDPMTAAAPQAAAPAPTRRSVLGIALIGLVAAGLAGGNAWWQWHARQPVFARAWRTRTAELLRVTLPDGATAGVNAALASTEVTLSAQTALRAALYRDRREIELSEGEARFDVLPDVARPFIVSTRLGRVEVVGTAFTVADRGGVLTVAVERGRVRVYPGPSASDSSKVAGGNDRPASTPIELNPGDVVRIRDGQPPSTVQRMTTADIGAWRSGWLVFDDLPLAEALPAVNAFRRAPLVLADAQTGRMRLTARFQVSDERGLLGALRAVLPVRVEPQADGSVVLRERPR